MVAQSRDRRLEATMKRAAVISECGQYRYQLSRTWDASLPFALFVGLNPSVADGEKDDNTIRRCIQFSKDWGYGGLMMANLFAYRATDHREMYMAADPIGPETDAYLAIQVSLAGLVVACWGVFGQYRGRDKQVVGSGVLRDYRALSLTKDGHPGHPLYLRGDLIPADPRCLAALR